MNYPLVLKLTSRLLLIEAAALIAPLAISLVCGDGDATAFAVTLAIILAAGLPASLIRPKKKELSPFDAFASTALIWIIFSIFGALPFYFTGYASSFVDCIFESVSGFTTTGATVFFNVESMPRGLVFWRGLTHWVGGMGVLMFILAVLPSVNMGASTANLYKAESASPSHSRIVPKIRQSAGILYLIYLSLTVILIISLVLTGLPVFDSFVNGFSIAGTGGFSVLNNSVGGYGNAAAEAVMTLFMLLFGINFSLYFFVLSGKLRNIINDDEFKFFMVVVLAAIVIIAADLWSRYGSFAEALGRSSFHVSSIVSTTGFFTEDYNMWPALSKAVLLFLMVTGCCAGSTSGGMKLVRVRILIKAARAETSRIIQPRGVKTVMVNGKRADSAVVTQAALFLFIYFAFAAAATILISIEGGSLTDNAAAAIAMLSNIGPGFGAVGPAGSYAGYSAFSKIVLSVCMVAGRLEFFPVLILFRPSLWRGRAAG